MKKYQIYQRELDRLLDAGLGADKAQREAAERAEEIYWDRVDAARSEAKSR